jgi:Rne/Rng family ribonuclease
MTEQPLTVIEPGIGCWRSADIGDDGLPTDLRFHDDVALSPLDGIFSACITQIDTANDLAFADLGGGLTGVLNLRRAKLLTKGPVSGINECLQEGQRLIVQVVSEPALGEEKALTITPRPRLAGRYVVVELGSARLNFSKDLGPATVKKLTPKLSGLSKNVSLIVRPRAASVPIEAVINEATALVAALDTAPGESGLMFTYTPLEKALVSVPDDSMQVVIEGGSAFAEARTCAQKWPDLLDRLAAFDEKEDAFEHYGVNEAIEEALAPRIDLPSGGWISITPTPALTAIDVNMGSALKGRTASDAKVLVNLEAALASLHHLRFQDIGGLVVIDFIDMTAKGATRELMRLIETTTRADRVPVQHTGISTFGMVELARKRSGLSLRDRMQVTTQPRLRAQSAALDLLRRGARVGRTAGIGALLVSGPEPVLAWLKRHPEYVEALKQTTSREVELMLGTSPDVFLRG